jgi:hypothetical protein
MAMHACNFIHSPAVSFRLGPEFTADCLPCNFLFKLHTYVCMSSPVMSYSGRIASVMAGR